MMSRATDVYPGGRRVLVNSGVINGYGIFTIGARGKWLKGGGGGSTTDHNYWYNDVGQQICEKETGAATVYRYYLHGYGLLSRKEGSLGTPEYLHTDMLGSITAITDNSGNEVATYAYDPFGDLLTSAQYLGNWAFTGQERDGETDFYHFPARYYEPEWGRFLTPDPWTGMPDDERNLVMQQYAVRTDEFSWKVAKKQGENLLHKPISRNKHIPSTLNPYQYVSNNPICFIDQNGLSMDCLGAILEIPKLLKLLKPPYDFNDKYIHCVAGCMIARGCGSRAAYELGFLVEIAEVSYGSEFSCEDIYANSTGISITSIENKFPTIKDTNCWKWCSYIWDWRN